MQRNRVLLQAGAMLLGLLVVCGLLGWYLLRPPVESLLKDADDHLLAGRASAAEKLLRQVLGHDPKQLKAHRQLASLLAIEGRRWESLPHLMILLEAGKQTREELLLAGNLEMTVATEETIAHLLKGDPQGVAPKITLGRLAAEKEPKKARRLFEEIIDQQPSLLEAQAQLGLLLAVSGFEDEFIRWHRAAPRRAEHPDYWVAHGLFAQRRGEAKVAARCFGEAFRLDPNHRVATHQLGLQLAAIGNETAAQRFIHRAELIDQMLSALVRLYASPEEPVTLAKLAEVSESLGRLLEARGWRRELLKVKAGDKDSLIAIARIEDRLARNRPEGPPPRTVFVGSPLLEGFDLESYPLPNWGAATAGPAAKSASRSAISFRDVASTSGLSFQYFAGRGGADKDDPGKFMYELTGGGVGAIDFDQDGWPDLLLTQGASWPLDPASEKRTDRLWRNRLGGGWEDVTDAAGVGGRGFGQGMAVGDWDNDGFADLYVANIGRNELYQNNGDGTFTRVTVEAGLTDRVWTTSCLIADLNGDGLPDLYDVNYLRGADLFTRRCPWDDGVMRICGPVDFEAEGDELFLNRGDGTFQRATKAAGITRSGGNGLGVVAFDLDADGTTDLFVANDQTQNHLYISQSGRGEPPRFRDRAKITGVAVDNEGAPQGCMGVAADDADGDGLIDLFVTNFSQEWYTLYRQTAPGVFADESHFRGLRNPTYDVLGFGTQFLDADLDGWPDLVAANGHIDDFTHKSWLYKMPAHLYRNLGEGVFERAAAKGLGDYFQRDVLGRGLAKLDWNRDGREDFAVTHLDTGAALLQNTTEKAGHFLAVRLIGVTCDRDAITTRVRLSSGEFSRTKQLTAGDGFQASNERRLVFGLGERDAIDEIVVHWPDGLVQTIPKPEADRELIIVQGSDDAFEGPR